ncbi:hypothetical protein P167DRAFT_261811 [Morchella conica CCBAS932]|uniref:Uncharacterized protein n=1 Tax=Morchella conica CCBAS932 TaxID=1392247 RepID=A0A3N4L513_9PEZI|nr:hypothetical protein P167DRAFT_261811 [Morchella conica CCBAS932]
MRRTKGGGGGLSLLLQDPPFPSFITSDLFFYPLVSRWFPRGPVVKCRSGPTYERYPTADPPLGPVAGGEGELPRYSMYEYELSLHYLNITGKYLPRLGVDLLYSVNGLGQYKQRE